MVRNPEYALNYLQSGAWARDWRDACEQDELRALTDKSLAQETALKVWESHDIGSREPNQKHLSRSLRPRKNARSCTLSWLMPGQMRSRAVARLQTDGKQRGKGTRRNN